MPVHDATSIDAPIPGLVERLQWRLRPWLSHTPRPPAIVVPSGPLVVAGMFRTGSGLGQSARACFDSLAARGYDPIPVCTSALLNQIDVDTDLPLQAFPAARQGTLILHANAPETEILLFRLGLRRWHSWRVIGYWAWELPILPDDWQPPSSLLSEIWTPSAFVSEAVGKRVRCPITTVPHAMQIGTTEESRETKADASRFTVLAMADGRSSLRRKNLDDAIAVFQTAFPDRADIQLIIKTRNLMDFPASAEKLIKAVDADRRIVLMDETLSRDDTLALLRRADIVLSCHRSEGFGLHLAEAMTLGRCVAATAWSGNLEFMTPANSLPLPFDLVPVDDPDNIYPDLDGSLWAQVRIEDAAAALRQLADDPDQRNEMAKTACSTMARFDGTAYAKALEGQ